MPPPPSEQALGELLARKEEEWRALQAQRTRLQEAALQEAQGRLQEAQGRLRRLQEDFVYNLQVLEERDHELERYDAAFAQAQRLEGARQAEVSELKVEAARLRQALAREARRREELQQQLQQKEQEHRLALRRAHSDKSSEVDRQREQYEKLQWTLERRLEQLDGQLALQRQELLLEFESETQKQEQAFRLQADSMSSVVLAHELKVKLLNEELGAQREAGAQVAESLRSAQAANSELEDRLQRATWELRDLAAVKDARIKELEDRLQSAQLTREKEEETFRRKHEELDRTARERDAVLASVKDAHAEQLRALEARVLELQAQCEALELQARRAEWRQADALREKDAAITRLREEASTLRSDWDAQVAQLSKEMTSRDLRVQSLQQEEAELQAQLARCQQDIGRYQRQLALAAEREQSLERDKAQLGLDWQRRCAGLERDHYRQSEELIQGLTSAREQAAAKLQEAERKLREQEAVLQAVTLERDQALQALRTHGLLPEQELQVLLGRRGEEAGAPGFPSGQIQQLQQQNASLRDAVARMRTEMEALSQQVLPPAQPAGGRAPGPAPQPDLQSDAHSRTRSRAHSQSRSLMHRPPPLGQKGSRCGGSCAEGSTAASVTEARGDYVLALEAEIRNLKCKFDTLEEQLGDVPEPPKAPSPQSDHSPPGLPPAAEASVGVGARGGQPPSLVDQASGCGRLWGAAVFAELRPQGLQDTVEDSVRRPLCFLGPWPRGVCLNPARTKRLGGDAAPPDSVAVGLALRRLGDRTRLLNLLVARLRQKALQEPREVGATQCALPHAADQVQLEALELQRQVAELQRHLGMAEPSRCVALGRQVLAAGGPSGTEDPGAPPPQAPSVPQLQRKLREAARAALRLQREKEQLLELGNRLRARLGRPAGTPGRPCPGPGAWNPGEGPETPWEHSRPLRQLQPHLARQGSESADGGRPRETPPHAAPAVGRDGAPRGTVAGTAGPGQKRPSISTATCKSALQKENRSPEPPQAPGPRQGRGPHTPGSSSLTSGSLQDTWRLLDLGSSPSGLASQDDSAPAGVHALHFARLAGLLSSLRTGTQRAPRGPRSCGSPPRPRGLVFPAAGAAPPFLLLLLPLLCTVDPVPGGRHPLAPATPAPAPIGPSVSSIFTLSAAAGRVQGQPRESRSPARSHAPSGWAALGGSQLRGAPARGREGGRAAFWECGVSRLPRGRARRPLGQRELSPCGRGAPASSSSRPRQEGRTVWRLGELTEPAAADRPRPVSGRPRETRAAFAVQGVKMDAQAKATPARPPRAHPANPKRCQRAPKIRNYNVKD
ncbi:coiled-coil domain-containing protein 57 [Phyllostomus hastatus]|uniref:coiled-coil domain-containing protein 57 n=1 Tax=Phyllostomus hastatus TaxID=9423 RepID=UPI001E67E377|nr:coiled-coil domain-containing protein 57 [Phyllostomus hastatus]